MVEVDPVGASTPRQDGAIPHAAILEALPMGIAIADCDGRTLYANAAERGIDPDGGRVFRSQTDTIETNDGVGYRVTTRVDMTAQTRLENDLFEVAYYDDVTRLPNRRLVERTVAGLMETSPGEVFALAAIEIDNFKHINDYYGPAASDGLLERIADRLSAAIRDSDVLARVEADGFALVITPTCKGGVLSGYVDGLLERLREPFFVDGNEIFCSTSIGISMYPAHGRNYKALMRNATSAVYRVKKDAKGGVHLYDPDVGDQAIERMKVEQRLRLAIRDRRLCCAFQPKVDFRADKVVGLEVLLRWRDEEGMIHAPGSLINLAVDLGLMDEVTLTVLRETISRIGWIDATFGPHVSVSINVAAKQAGDFAFMSALAEEIAATGCANRFMIELTEEAFLAKGPFQSQILPMLRSIGARVSIDDFGVGYSSLSALADITADEIKVDRSFITEIHCKPRNQAILKVIETLGTALGMSVIVEGVETAEELAYMRVSTQIRYAQGFYFSRPLMLEEAGASDGRGLGVRAPILSRAPLQSRVR